MLVFVSSRPIEVRIIVSRQRPGLDPIKVAACMPCLLYLTRPMPHRRVFKVHGCQVGLAHDALAKIVQTVICIALASLLPRNGGRGRTYTCAQYAEARDCTACNIRD